MRGPGSWLVVVTVATACSSPRSQDPPATDADTPLELDAAQDSADVPNLTDPDWPADLPIPAELDFPPYLNLLDAQTVVVSWRTHEPTTGVVRFGTTPSHGLTAASSTPTNLHHVTLGPLLPGSAYHYEVAVDGTAAVRTGVFVMPGRAGWRFMHAAEFHAPSESRNVVAFTAAIRGFRPHVLVESGDMADDGNNLEHWRSYLRTSAPWIGNVLLLPSHSNHVNGSGGNATLKELFVVPGNERWYTTRYGQVEFFNVDSTIDSNQDVMTVEVPWLATAVAAAHDGTADPTFVVASWHHPACSSQYYTRYGERNWVQTNLVATMKASGGVDLVLAGHDKYYERSTITGGIVHVISNIGQVSPEIPGNNHDDCTAIVTSRSRQSVALFTVEGTTLSGRVVDELGGELDTFAIVK